MEKCWGEVAVGGAGVRIAAGDTVFTVLIQAGGSVIISIAGVCIIAGVGAAAAAAAVAGVGAAAVVCNVVITSIFTVSGIVVAVEASPQPASPSVLPSAPSSSASPWPSSSAASAPPCLTKFIYSN